MNAATLHQVSLQLGHRTVLQQVSLALPAGAFIALLGPNGAGKTTLIRALLGLLRPQSGQIEVLGAPARPGRAGIGYLPQFAGTDTGLNLCGRAFVAAAASGAGWGLPAHGRKTQTEIDRALDWVGATTLANRVVGELSGGERQRLRLATALLGNPQLLLLDEPLASLDPAGQIGIVALIRQLQRELGLTILFSAHDVNPLLPGLDQVLYLAQGRAAIGPVASIITGPALSRLYAAPVEVVHAQDRIFVLTAA